MPAGRGRLHAVILAGGAGERFWPASRQRHPKPFLKVVEGRSLLDATLVRARRVAGADRVWAVAGREHVISHRPAQKPRQPLSATPHEIEIESKQIRRS